VNVGGIIYDNLTIEGLDFAKWLKDLGYGEVPYISWKTTKEILNY